MDLRFVVLRHEGIAEPHFDLLFETSPGSALAAWRSGVWPIATDAELVQLADHRREYLTYEGPISGNRGHVHRVAAGESRALPRHAAPSGEVRCGFELTWEQGHVILELEQRKDGSWHAQAKPA